MHCQQQKINLTGTRRTSAQMPSAASQSVKNSTHAIRRVKAKYKMLINEAYERYEQLTRLGRLMATSSSPACLTRPSRRRLPSTKSELMKPAKTRNDNCEEIGLPSPILARWK